MIWPVDIQAAGPRGGSDRHAAALAYVEQEKAEWLAHVEDIVRRIYAGTLHRDVYEHAGYPPCRSCKDEAKQRWTQRTLEGTT